MSELFGGRSTRQLLSLVLDPRALDVRGFLDRPLVAQKDNERLESALDRALAEAGLARFTSWWCVVISTPELLALGGSWESPVRAKALASLRRCRGNMVRDGLLARELEATYGDDPHVRGALDSEPVARRL